MLAGAILSIALNPFTFRAIEPIRKWLLACSELARRFDRSVEPLAELPMSVPLEKLAGQVVLVGYGRVGRMIGRLLQEHGVSYVVIEENREIVLRLRSQGIPAIAGDAAEGEVLIQAHIARASALIVVIPDTFDVRAMVQTARMLNPSIATAVRTHSEEEAMLLRKERIGQIFMGEHELAKGMATHILSKLK